MSEDPSIQPIVRATKQATIHLAKAAFELFAAGGALVSGVRQVVSGDEPEPDDGPQHVTVE